MPLRAAQSVAERPVTISGTKGTVAPVQRGGAADHPGQTTKIEAYNDFLDWVTFGGPVVKSGDPIEQEKQLKYASLVANAVMLSNVADLTRVLTSMARDGHPVTPELVACTSPYMRRHVLRFGKYTLDMDSLPEPLDPQPLSFEVAEQAATDL